MRLPLLRRARIAAFAVAALALALHARGAELKIAVAADVTSIDPHFFNLFPNNNIAEHIFDKLVQMDPDSKMIPGLATSWKTIDDKTWEFKLRKGVKFTDGSELTAEDVVFSIDRVPNVPNSPGPFSAYTKAIVAKEIVDPYTIRFKYAAPYPLAPNDLSTIYIVSKKAATGASTEDFNTGKATIGSGRYKFVKYSSGDRDRARPQRQLLGRQVAVGEGHVQDHQERVGARRRAAVGRRRRDRAAADGRPRAHQGAIRSSR